MEDALGIEWIDEMPCLNPAGEIRMKMGGGGNRPLMAVEISVYGI